MGRRFFDKRVFQVFNDWANRIGSLHSSHPILIPFSETVEANEVEEIHEKLLDKCPPNNNQSM